MWTALESLRSEAGMIDAAILDVNLNGIMTFDLADHIGERGRTAILGTGYDRSVLPACFQGAPSFEKPYHAVVDALETLYDAFADRRERRV
jgi:hypothetical protein